MTQPDAIAGAIEEQVVERIYYQIERMLENDGYVQAHWMIQQVADFFAKPVDSFNDVQDELVTPGYVSWLLWEQINEGRLSIDSHGMIIRGTTPTL